MSASPPPLIDSDHPREKWLLIVVIPLIAIGLSALVNFEGRTLWLDEFGSWWVTNGSIFDVWHRSHLLVDKMPGYYVILWCFRSIFGDNEFALRSPSLVFAFLTVAALVWHLRMWSFGAVRTVSAIFLLIVNPMFAGAATNARPYALLIFLSVLLFIISRSSAHRLSAAKTIITSLLGASLVYTHLLGALLLTLPLVPMLYFARERGVKITIFHLVLFGTSTLVLLSPLIPWVFRTSGAASSLSYGSGVSILGAVQPLVVSECGIAFCCWGIAFLLGKKKKLLRGEFFLVLLALAGFLMPTIEMIVASSVLGGRFYYGTYLSMTAPFSAILCVALLTSITRPVLRYLPILLWGLNLLFVSDQVRYLVIRENFEPLIFDDIRSLKDKYPECAIWYSTGFVGAQRQTWFENSEMREFFESPMSYYGIKPSVLLPIGEGGEISKEYLDEYLARTQDPGGCIMWILRPVELMVNGRYILPLSSSLKDYLRKRAFRVEYTRTSSDFNVTLLRTGETG